MQAGRGIAALLIVVQHVAYNVGNSPRYWHRQDIFRALAGTALGVEFFFVLSGIVIWMAHHQDFGRPASVASFAWKRIRRIYPLYWIVFVPWMALVFHTFPHYDPESHNAVDYISNMLLLHLRSAHTDMAIAWTLFHEILFYLVFACLILSQRLGIAVFAVWLAGAVWSPWATPSPMAEFYFSPVHMLFALGMGVAWLLSRQAFRMPRTLFASGCILFLISMVLAWPFGDGTTWVRLLAGFASAVGLAGAMELERQGRLRVPAPLAFLGDASFAIYLANYPVLAIAAPGVFHAAMRFHVPLAPCMLLLFLVGTTAGCCLHVFVEKPLLRWMGGFGRPAMASYDARLPLTTSAQ